MSLVDVPRVRQCEFMFAVPQSETPTCPSAAMTTPTPLLLTLAASVALAFATPAAGQTASTSTPATTRPASTTPATAPAPGAKPAPVAAEFAAMDGNNDGSVSTSEHEVAAAKMFAMMDADGDHNVTAAEMDAARQKIAGHAAGASEMNSAQKIRAIDTNHDGILSQTEHTAGAAAMFHKMDGDSNGSLSSQEFDAGRADMMQSGASGY